MEQQCNSHDCGQPARMAIRTTRPSRDRITTQVYWDNRTAPRTAEQLCRAHGGATLLALVTTLVHEDGEN